MKTAIEPSSGVARYIARTRDIPRLSREEEYALAIRVRDQDDRIAGEKIIEANLRHVVSIALIYRRYGLRVADLIAEGNVGLMTALRKFDPDRGTRFVTYAAHWIRAYILEYVLRAWSIVGVGSGPLRSKVFFRLRREQARIATVTNDPDDATALLASRFNTTPEKIAALAGRLEARDVSLDATVNGDGPTTGIDRMPSPLPSQEEQLFSRERHAEINACVREAVSRLDPRERFIVEARVMADDPDELSLAELGRRLGVSRERARQLESRAKSKMKKQLEELFRGRKAELLETVAA